jgi:hypothetical protein
VGQQLVPQGAAPDGQVMHCPPLQEAPLGQTTLQAPQLLESVCVSTQLVPQNVPPNGHTHLLEPLHTSEGRQQIPAQSVQPNGQPQTPPIQAVSPGQAFPQAPQLVSSLCRLTHLPLHTVAWPAGQTHWPLTQLVHSG